MTGKCDGCRFENADKCKEPCISCANNQLKTQSNYRKDYYDAPSTSIFGFLIPGWSRGKDVEAGEMMETTLTMFAPAVLLFIMSCLLLFIIHGIWAGGAHVIAIIAAYGLIRLDIKAWRYFKHKIREDK